jgi:hypothetical protein
MVECLFETKVTTQVIDFFCILIASKGIDMKDKECDSTFENG